MNMLDSELVVASLRKAGLRAGRHAARGRHDPVQHVQRPPACRGQNLQRPGPPEARQEAQSAQDHRRARLHGPEGSAADLRAGSVCRSGRRAGAVAPDSATARRRSPPAAGRRWKSASTARRAAATKSSRASKATIPLAIRQMRPSPYQAFVRIMIGCDKFCTYCIVPDGSRARARAGRPRHIVAEARKLADEGCREITLLGQTVNSYRHTRRRPHDAAVRSARSTARDRRPRPAEVRHQLSQGHDRRSAGRPCAICRSARPICTCRPRAARTPCCSG